MAEIQVHQISIRRDNLHAQGCDCGGGYRIVTLEIFVDSSLPVHFQKIALVHELLGGFFGSVIEPDILSEAAEKIVDSLEDLDEQGRE